jgi:hypothetical protein
MARYGQKFKERVVARLLPPESSPVEAVSHTVGISAAILSENLHRTNMTTEQIQQVRAEMGKNVYAKQGEGGW